MLKNFRLSLPANPISAMQGGLILLVAANLVAGYFVLRPIGGSAEDLKAQAESLRTTLRQQQATLDRTRLLAGKIESGRGQGDSFMDTYFLPRRTAYSMIMGELNDIAMQSKVMAKEGAFSIEPVEGSDTLEMMQISANYEATYSDLIQFVNKLDKSDRLLVIESLNATPQQTGGRLSVMLKLDTFVRQDGVFE
jgi:Tfp pilus assembly protein PilO